LGASCQGTALGSDRFENSTGPRQVYFKDVVNSFLEHHLETFAQTGRWSDNQKHGPFRQENNPSFSGFIELEQPRRMFLSDTRAWRCARPLRPAA
jgi:hypothetical protein